MRPPVAYPLGQGLITFQRRTVGNPNQVMGTRQTHRLASLLFKAAKTPLQ
jgi:hypothetical protein